MLVSLKGSNVDLMHVLFGTVLALNNDALVMIGAIATISLVGLALIWRPLFAECLDPTFLRSVSKAGQPVHLIFLGAGGAEPGRAASRRWARCWPWG